MKKTFWRILKTYGIITISCLLYAFSFNCFFQPNNIAMGGFTGVSQILNKLFPVLPIGTTVFVMNVPLMIIGVRKQGWGLLFSSLYATFVSSIMIDTMNMLYTFPAMDPLLASIYGGVLMGISLGLMLLYNATTGGTELLARLLKYVIHNLSIGKLCLVIDTTIVSLHALCFHNVNGALYGVIAMYVCSIAMDMVIYGSANAKLAYIISDKCDEISQRLMDMEMGATILNGKGAYTGNNKNILMCAAKPSRIAQIKAIAAEIDPGKAFVIVTDAKEVYGEGFSEYSGDSL